MTTFATFTLTKKLAKMRNFSAKHFFFQRDGGRCEVCKGEGEVTIECSLWQMST